MKKILPPAVAALSVFLGCAALAAEEEALTWNDKAMSAFSSGEKPEQIVLLLERGVREGETEAMVNLAGFAARGIGMKKDEAKAFTLFEQAAAKGNSAALLNLGLACLHGKGTAPDPEKGRALLRKAEEAGESEAAYLLGVLAEKDQDLPGAMRHYAAAGKEHNKALNRLGILTYLHEDDPKSDEHALKCLLTAAFRKYPPALNNAAYVLTHRTDGKAPDWKAAEVCYKSAAEKGYAPAQFNLGILYSGGAGSDFFRPEEAVKHLRDAAAQDHAGAQYLLGTAYRDGDGVPRDEAKAFEYYRLSAEQGYPFACLQLAEMLSKGRGTGKDDAAAEMWRKRAEELRKKQQKSPDDSMQSSPEEKKSVR